MSAAVTLTSNILLLLQMLYRTWLQNPSKVKLDQKSSPWCKMLKHLVDLYGIYCLPSQCHDGTMCCSKVGSKVGYITIYWFFISTDKLLFYLRPKYGHPPCYQVPKAFLDIWHGHDKTTMATSYIHIDLYDLGTSDTYQCYCKFHAESDYTVQLLQPSKVNITKSFDHVIKA